MSFGICRSSSMGIGNRDPIKTMRKKKCECNKLIHTTNVQTNSSKNNTVIGGSNIILNGNQNIILKCNDKERVYSCSNECHIDSESIVSYGKIQPLKDGRYSIGTFNNRWSEVFSTTGSINTSDSREKRNIKVCKYGLDELLRMEPVEFDWKDESKNRINKKSLGFIAQDLEKVVPEVVYKPSDKHESLKKEKEYDRRGLYSHQLLPVVVKAIQELCSMKETSNNKISI